MDHGSLFTGIGGFDLAAEWMGWENVFQVEWDGFCQKVLAKNFPNVKRYGDIREFNGTKYRGLIDILTGGFPCQPFSVAGKQKGKSDDRYLWPEMLRVIREIQPSWITGENVPGIIRMELENICLALEGEGYEVQPIIIPSASIGAWDKRDRVWIIAHNKNVKRNRDNCGCRGLQLSKSMEMEEVKRLCCEKYKDGKGIQKSVNAQSYYRCSNRGGSGSHQSKQIRQQENEFTDRKPLGEQSQQGEREWNTQAKGEKQMVCSNLCKQCKNTSGMFRYKRGSDGSKKMCGIKINSDINGFDSDNTGYNSGSISQQQEAEVQFNSDIECKGMERHPWHELTKGQKEEIRRNGQTNWSRNWIEVASELCRSNARVPNRMDRIKALGNSVNPYVVFQIFKAIEDYDTQKKNQGAGRAESLFKLRQFEDAHRSRRPEPKLRKPGSEEDHREIQT